MHPEERNSDDKLQQRFEWINRWAATDMDYMSNYVFVDESGFNINMRSPSAWSTVDTPAIVKTKSTRAISHTILGALSVL